MRALIITVAILLSGCGERQAALTPIAAARAAALPSLSFRLASGEQWTSDAALGRVIVLDVWATYCQPCRHAFPKLSRLAAAHPEVLVIGVSVDDEDDAVAAFLREVPAGFAIARDPDQTVQSGPLAIQTLPTVLVVDRRGRIRVRADKASEADYDALPGVIDALRVE